MLQLSKRPHQEVPVLKSCEIISIGFNAQREKQFFQDLVPMKYKNSSLETMDLQPQVLIDFGYEWAKNPTSLFLFGNKGAGKTRYGFALVRELFRVSQRYFWPRFFTSPALDSELHKAIMSGEGDSYCISKLVDCDLLMIDDFGRENSSERTRRQYFEIINERYAREALTIITSNFDLAYIEKELKMDVIASRLEEFKKIKFTGPDLRKQEIIA